MHQCLCSLVLKQTRNTKSGFEYNAQAAVIKVIYQLYLFLHEFDLAEFRKY